MLSEILYTQYSDYLLSVICITQYGLVSRLVLCSVGLNHVSVYVLETLWKYNPEAPVYFAFAADVDLKSVEWHLLRTVVI